MTNLNEALDYYLVHTFRTSVKEIQKWTERYGFWVGDYMLHFDDYKKNLESFYRERILEVIQPAVEKADAKLRPDIFDYND